MSSTFFSIVVPVYNTKKEYLIESLESLLSLKYDNYEIVVVDDGSNSDTVDLLNSYEQGNLKVIHQINSGQHIARINGVKHSKGEYVLFVDSDDLFDANNLGILNQILTTKKYDMVLFDFRRFDKNSNDIVIGSFFEQERELQKKEVIKEFVSLHIGSVCMKAIKKSLISLKEIDINRSIRKGEDLVQSCDEILSCNSFYYTNRVIYRYRINRENRSYYDFSNIDNINYLVPIYKKIFGENKDYIEFLSIFKTHCINDVLYTCFKYINTIDDNNKRIEYLNLVNGQEIIKIIENMDCDISIFNRFFYSVLKHKKYNLLVLLAKTYKVIDKTI